MQSDMLLDKYISNVQDVLSSLDNSIDKDELKKFIIDRYIKPNTKLEETHVKLSNNYEQTEIEVNLHKLINYYYDEKPIMTTFGTLFEQHKDSVNLNADFINYLMVTRKAHKKLQFEGQVEHDIAKESFHKKNQLAWKVLNNSYYGVTGQSSSQFFNLLIAQSVTYTGYSIITTSILAFEKFMSNNYKYSNFNDFMIFLNDVIDTSSGITKYIDVENLKTKKEVAAYLMTLIDFKLSESNKNLLKKFLKNANTDVINALYYKNNLYEFLKNSYFINLLKPFFELEIIDPNKAPDDVKDTMSHIWELLYKYVYHDRQIFGREQIITDYCRSTVLG